MAGYVFRKGATRLGGNAPAKDVSTFVRAAENYLRKASVSRLTANKALIDAGIYNSQQTLSDNYKK